ncbi:MAG: TonB-dependent receptor, partial [Bacteroidetes bacterium]
KFTPYFSYFPNFIYLQKTALNSTIYQYMQTSSVNFGAEFQAFYHPAKKWSISTGAAYTEQRKVQTNEWLPLTPPLQIFGEAEFDLTLKQWALHAYVRPKFVATQNKTAEFELSTPSFLVTDAGISFSRKNIQVISSVNNVFNNKYFNHLSVFRPIGIYEPARNIFIKLVIDLQKEI